MAKSLGLLDKNDPTEKNQDFAVLMFGDKPEKYIGYSYVEIEELVANAIVHNNYENGKPIQIF